MSNRRKIVPAEGVGPSGLLEMTGTNIRQQATPRSRPAEDAKLAPERPGAHVWIANSVHRLSDESAAATMTDGGPPVNLDLESLVTVMVGCWTCEEVYTSELAGSRCPGEPR